MQADEPSRSDSHGTAQHVLSMTRGAQRCWGFVAIIVVAHLVLLALDA